MQKSKMHRTLKQEVELLPNLVRMVDLMIVGALCDVVTNGVAALQEAFERSGVLLTSVTFADEGRTFDPALRDIHAEFSEHFVDQLLRLVAGVPRVLHHQHFLPLFQKQLGRKALGPDLASVVLTSKHISRAHMTLERTIAKSFAEADTRTKHLEELRAIVEFGRVWDAEEYTAKERDLAQFRKDMTLMRAWGQQARKGRGSCGRDDCSGIGPRAGWHRAPAPASRPLLSTIATAVAHRRCRRLGRRSARECWWSA